MFITINTCCDNYYFLVNDGYAVVTVNETSSSCYSNCTNNDNSNNNNSTHSTSTDTINSPSTTSDNIATYHIILCISTTKNITQSSTCSSGQY